MTRTSIKIDQTTRDRLAELKRDGETWDALMHRLAEYAEIARTAD